ncbi:AprA-related methyltransferase [Chryseobacterium indoltheticum]|uniref:AprA-related methyltransferase n=1 Tax=Chryseobacterium indoltheticum TaxID=254 RepID=UPI003F4976F2
MIITEFGKPENNRPTRISTSNGAFAHRGKRLPNNLVEESLKEHLELWLPTSEKTAFNYRTSFFRF